MKMATSFEDYMDAKVPTWKTDISQETIKELRIKFNKVVQGLERVNNVFDMALRHNKSGIDYSTDLQKANDNLALCENNLESDIKAIRQVMGLDTPEEIEQLNKTI